MDGAHKAEGTAGAPVFAGPGEMRALCRALDWAATPLGSVETWVQSLRTAVQLALAQPFASVVLWGPDLVQIYNDACRDLMGVKHPVGLGQPTRECWPEVWHINAPIYERVREGESLAFEDALYPITRSGILEDAWFTLSHSPLRDERGAVAGVFVTILETTDRVRAQTALQSLNERLEERVAERTAALRASEEALRDSAAQLRLALDLAELGTWTWDLTTGAGHLDARGAQIVGLPSGDLPNVGEAQLASIHPEDLARTQTAAAAGVGSGNSFDLNYRVVHADGSIRHVASRARVFTDEAGHPQRLVGTNRDVTAEREAEARLRASEARYRTLVENVQDYAFFMVNPAGVVTEWTTGAERVMGYSAEEVVGRHLSHFYDAEDAARGEPAKELAEAAAAGRAEREAWRVRKDGERFWANEIATAVRAGDGSLVGFTKISRDLTERRQAEEATKRARAEAERDALRQLLIQAEEEERRRLARELHDEVGQHLAALGLGLQALSDVALPGSEVDRRAAQLSVLVGDMGRELHALAVRLRPKALDDFGLEAALVAYAEDWSRRSGIAVDVHARAELERLPSAVESAIYRVVQEALTNVARHSGAARASVIVKRRDSQVIAVVEDSGRGFDADAPVQSPAGRTGLGLLGIRERVALLGGTVEVESAPGGGTAIFVRIPIRFPTVGSAGIGDLTGRVSQVAERLDG